MKNQAQVVVIGGGVVGASILYHLSKLGCHDAIMLERSELTSGSTWHAAGGMHTINGDPNVAKLQQYTIKLYQEIEELSGQNIGLHMTGGIMLAATNERFDWLKSVYAKGKYLGMDDLEIITPQRAHELMPLIDPEQFVGAMYDPVEGHVDPYGVTHAYAKAARKNGASYETHVMVKSLSQTADGSWHVKTNKGTIIAEHVVNAAGLWAREVGRMVGLELPVLAMEHMYLLTEDMPEVTEINQKTGAEVLHAVDFDGDGKINLIKSPADAIGSVANYLSIHGWKPNELSHAPVNPRKNSNPAKFVSSNLKAESSIKDLKKAGIILDSVIFPPNLSASLIDLPEKDGSVKYWLATPNFFAVTKYNRSFMYAAAVFTLAESITPKI